MEKKAKLKLRHEVEIVLEVIKIIDNIDYENLKKNNDGLCHVCSLIYHLDCINFTTFRHQYNRTRASKFSRIPLIPDSPYWFYRDDEGYEERKNFMEFVKQDLYKQIFEYFISRDLEFPDILLLELLKSVKFESNHKSVICYQIHSRLTTLSGGVIFKPFNKKSLYHFSKFFSSSTSYYHSTWFALDNQAYKEREIFVNWMIKYYSSNKFKRKLLLLQLPFRYFYNRLIKSLIY